MRKEKCRSCSNPASNACMFQYDMYTMYVSNIHLHKSVIYNFSNITNIIINKSINAHIYTLIHTNMHKTTLAFKQVHCCSQPSIERMGIGSN